MVFSAPVRFRPLLEFASFSVLFGVSSSLMFFSFVGATGEVAVEGVVVVAEFVSTPAPVTVGLLRGLDDELSSTTISLFTQLDVELEEDCAETAESATPLLFGLLAPFTTLL